MREAEQLLKRSVMVWEQARGADDPGIARPLNNLGVLYRKLRLYGIR